MLLVRCGKPINHQRSLRASISQEACHPPAAIPSAGKLPAASGVRGGARGRPQHLAERAGAPECSQLRGPRDLRRPLPLASLCFEVLWLWPGVGVGKPGLQPAGFKGFNIRSTSSLQLLWAVLKATKGVLGDFPAAQVEAATSPRTDPS